MNNGSVSRNPSLGSRRPSSAVVVLVDKDGQALYLRRGPTDPWKPGRWNFPGGKVDPGEWVRHAAQRELREEAGIHVRVSELVPVFSYSEGRDVYVFLARVARRPAVVLADQEHDAYTWRPLTDSPLPTIPALPLVASRVVAALRKTGQASKKGRIPMGQPIRYPGYLPYPHAIGRSPGPVPNQQSVDWPQSQFAPEFLPPGSPSYQPYRFRHGYHPLRRMKRLYMADRPALAPEGTYPASGFDPGTDIAATPYGDCGCARANPSMSVDLTPWVVGALLVGGLYWYVGR